MTTREAPADTRMMGIVHAARKRDLRRAREVLGPEHFPMSGSRRAASQQFELPEEGLNLETVERELVVQALKRTGWNHTKAAALLGLNRDQIRYRVEKFGLEKTAGRE